MEQQTTIKDNWNSIEPKKSLRVIRPPVNLEEHITLLSYVYVIKQQKFVDMDNPENTFAHVFLQQ